MNAFSRQIVILCGLCLAALGCQAEPTGVTTKVIKVRPYAGGQAYIQLEQLSPCNTGDYMIDLTQVGGREIYAAALTAYATNAPVWLEVVSCTGWGSRVQSLTLVK